MLMKTVTIFHCRAGNSVLYARRSLFDCLG